MGKLPSSHTTDVSISGFFFEGCEKNDAKHEILVVVERTPKSKMADSLLAPENDRRQNLFQVKR